MHFLEICENLGNLRIAREFYGDHQKSNEANPMSSDCEADVEKEEHTRVKRPWSRCREGSSSRMRSLLQRMRSRCQDGHKAYVKMMRSRCQGKCEVDLKTNAKPTSRRPWSRCREGIHTRTRWMEVNTNTNTLTPNGNTQSNMFYLCLHSFLALLLFL